MTNDRNEPISAPKDVTSLLAKWIIVAAAYEKAHKSEAIALKKRHYTIGAPSAVLSAIVGTSIFAAIQEAAKSASLKTLLAALSISASACAALVTFYGLAERSTNHKIASSEYDEIKRQMETMTTSITQMAPDEWRKTLEGVAQRLEAIARRVDPPSMLVSVQKEVREIALLGAGQMSAAPRRKEVVTVRHPKVPRKGFAEELLRVYVATTSNTNRDNGIEGRRQGI